MIFLDVDDTLADFKGALVKAGAPMWEGTYYMKNPAEWTDFEREHDRISKEIMDRHDFWPSIVPHPRAFELIAAASHRAPTYLLTATPHVTNFRERIAAQKLEWAQRVLHFPEARVIICERHEKVRYAATKRDLLIDDAAKNCEEWEAAGGRAHLYTNVPAAIKWLKKETRQ